jgi:hypothetical protein
VIGAESGKKNLQVHKNQIVKKESLIPMNSSELTTLTQNESETQDVVSKKSEATIKSVPMNSSEPILRTLYHHQTM